MKYKKAEKGGLTLTYSIDEASFGALRANQFKAFYGLAKVAFRVLMEGIRVLQINLQHSRAASAALTRTMGDYDIALIQEPWVSRGKILGLSGINGELIYSRSTKTPRACIIAKNNVKILPLTDFCFRDLAAVKLRLSKDGAWICLPSRRRSTTATNQGSTGPGFELQSKRIATHTRM